MEPGGLWRAKLGVPGEGLLPVEPGPVGVARFAGRPAGQLTASMGGDGPGNVVFLPFVVTRPSRMGVDLPRGGNHPRC